MFPSLYTALMHEAEISPSFTVVITNPPFGEDLKVAAADTRAGGYSIAKAAAMGGSSGPNTRTRAGSFIDNSLPSIAKKRRLADLRPPGLC